MYVSVHPTRGSVITVAYLFRLTLYAVEMLYMKKLVPRSFSVTFSMGPHFKVKYLEVSPSSKNAQCKYES